MESLKTNKMKLSKFLLKNSITKSSSRCEGFWIFSQRWIFTGILELAKFEFLKNIEINLHFEWNSDKLVSANLEILEKKQKALTEIIKHYISMKGNEFRKFYIKNGSNNKIFNFGNACFLFKFIFGSFFLNHKLTDNFCRS